MNKLGHTWYPKDWWTSKTYRRLKKQKEGVLLRYAYREILDYLYTEGGSSELDQEEIEDRFDLTFSKESFQLLENEFVIEDGIWTHETVNVRLRKANVSRENGKKGGRPKKQVEDENSSTESVENQEEKPRKPKKKPAFKKKVNKSKLKESKYSAEELQQYQKLQSWIKQFTPSLNRMKKPLTIEEYFKLKSKFPAKLLTEKMKAMENKPKLVSTYKSTYATLCNWCKRSLEDDKSKEGNTSVQVDNLMN